MTTRSQQYKSLLGIELNSEWMTVVSVFRGKQGFSVKNQMSAPLTLDPLSHDPELVGQEIRNQLDRMGIHEKQCMICLPLQWLMCLSVPLPELSPEDETNYIRLQAEREFPFSADDLSLSLSRFTTPGSHPYATIAAIPLNHSQILQKVFKAAKLKPVSVTAGIASMLDRKSQSGTIALYIKESSIEFMIHAGGGVVVLRRLEYESHDSEIELDDVLENIVREIRITLGQLAAEWKGVIRNAQIYGSGGRSTHIIQRLSQSLADLGLKIDSSSQSGLSAIHIPDRIEQPAIPLIKTVVRFLVSESVEFEFLPPQIHRFKQITQRISSKSNLVLGGSLAAILIAAIIAVTWQYIHISSLESEWNRIKVKVGQLEELQKKVKKFRPWFDDSAKSLAIIKTLTEAFPEEGTVWVKMIEIQDQDIIACAGFAKTYADWLSMIDQLYGAPQVTDLEVLQTQGLAPVQFAFNFRWVEGAGHGK